MTLPIADRKKLINLIIIFSIIGLGIGALAYYFSDDVATAISNTFKQDASQANTGDFKGIVFHDVDANGIRNELEASEHPVPNVDIIFSNQYISFAGSTDATGSLSIQNITAGTYQVTAKVADNFLSVSPETLTIDPDRLITESLLVNAGGMPLGSIAGGAYQDQNGNGAIDPEEAKLADLTVSLQTGGREIATTTTDDQGDYSFDSLEAGSYIVKVLLTDKYRKENGIVTLPGAEFVILRSNIDSRSINLLFNFKTQSTGPPQYMLASATPTVGLNVIKLGSDNDETDEEFVHVEAGETVSFNITVEALGLAGKVLSDVKVIDPYPNVLKVGNITNAGVDNGSAITWNLGDLTVGDTTTLTYNALVLSGTKEGHYLNEATVTATNIDPEDDDATIIVQRSAEFAGSTSNSANSTSNATDNTSSDTSDNENIDVPKVGVEAWMLAGLIALPIAAISVVSLAVIRRSKVR